MSVNINQDQLAKGYLIVDSMEDSALKAAELELTAPEWCYVPNKSALGLLQLSLPVDGMVYMIDNRIDIHFVLGLVRP